MFRYFCPVRWRRGVAMLPLWTLFLLASVGSSRNHEEGACPISDLPACGPRAVCDCSVPLLVNCSSRGLSLVPANLSTDLRLLALDNNKLSCIPKNFFQAFYQLSEIDITGDHIKKSFVLPSSLRILQMEGNRAEDADNFFLHCDHLSHAMMNGNQIRNVTEFTFQKCSKLENLEMNGNLYKEIWNYSFTGLTSLQSLLIGGPSLQTIHEASISTFCENLITLEIQNSKALDNLPPSLIRGCPQIKELLIHHTSVTELDSNIFSGNSLWKLDLSHNEMRNIASDVFKGLVIVRELYLSFNNMARIPGLLLQNTSIEYTLDLSNNDLEYIPGELFNSNPRGHTVTALFFSGNKLATIPSELFRSLHNLEHIFLHGNMIESLPGYFLSGTSARSLFLFQNFIRNFSMPLFRFVQGNESLEELQLQDNPIEVLSSEVFRGIVKSGNVTLSCDKLTIPPFHAINLKCAPSNLPMVIVSPKVESKLLSSLGFHCLGSGIDNLGVCVSCSAGTYGKRNLWDKRKCEDCPRGGFYQDQIGQYSRDGSSIACKHCNPGTFVMEGAGDSPLSCKVCPSGTNKSAHAGFRACFCLENYFRRDRFGKCELCPVDGVGCQAEYVTIKENYYWNWSYTDIEYYKRFVANLKTLNKNYPESSSSLTIALPMVHKCLKNGRCANDLDDIEGNCAEGYAGWMCTSCDQGYFPIFGFCHKCPEITAFIAEISAILFFVAFVLLILMKYPHRKTTGRSLVDIALARGKIVLGFYQIMGEFWESIDVIFWPELFKSISSWFDFLQFNISSILIKPSCFNPSLTLTPYSAFVLGSLLPYFVMAVTACSILILKLRANYHMKRHPGRNNELSAALERHRNTILTAATLILFVTYTSTCNVTFELYSPTCDRFSLDEQGAHNISILRSDYSISCATSKHRNFQIAAYVASVYVFAFPGVLFFILKKYSGNRVSRAFGPDDHVAQSRSYPGWLRFLVENYKPQYWFWEIIELVRKVSQTFVIILFGWNSSLSITITLTLSVIFLTLHCSFSPMEDKFEHHLQLASLWGIFCNMLVAAVPVPDSFDEYANIMSVFLILVNIGVIGLLVVTTLLKILRFVYNTEIFRCFRDCLSDVDPLPIIDDNTDDQHQLLIN